MRVALSILFCFAFVSNAVSQSQPKKDWFVLTGKLTGRDTGSLILWYPDLNGQFVKDTTSIKGGSFQFEGKLNQPAFCWLKEPGAHGRSAGFFMEPGSQYIVINKNDFENFKMVGSYAQKQDDSLKKERQKILTQYKKWMDEKDSLLSQFSREGDPIEKKKLDEKLDTLIQRNNIIYKTTQEKTIAFISSHPDSYVSPSYLNGMLTGRTLTTDSVEKLYDRFSERIKNSIAGKRIRKEIEKRELNIAVPDFQAMDINGTSVSLSEFKGKYVLIDFWASWCVPCLKQLPELKELYSKYNDSGFEIIMVSIDESRKNWEEAIKKYEVGKFYHALANEDIRSKYSNTSQPIPSQLLVSKDGMIIWNSMNQSMDLKKILEKKLVNKP